MRRGRGLTRGSTANVIERHEHEGNFRAVRRAAFYLLARRKGRVALTNFDLLLFLLNAGREKAKNLSGGNVLRLIQIRFVPPSWKKPHLPSSTIAPPARIADSSSKNAVSISSARTRRRSSSPRCASAIQIVRPLQSTALTYPQSNRL